MKVILMAIFFLFGTLAIATETEHEVPAGLSFYDEKTGEFSLKENVVKNFGIEMATPLAKGNVYEVPSEAIVKSLMKTEVFIVRSGRFKLISVQIVGSSEGTTRVIGNLDASQVVVRGNNFLKTVMLALEEGPAEDH